MAGAYRRRQDICIRNESLYVKLCQAILYKPLHGISLSQIPRNLFLASFLPCYDGRELKIPCHSFRVIISVTQHPEYLFVSSDTAKPLEYLPMMSLLLPFLSYTGVEYS